MNGIAQNTKKYVYFFLKYYYPIIVGGGVLFIGSLFVPHAEYLYLSPTRPWSILTYMFVYDGSGNIKVFTLLIVFYLIVSYRFNCIWKLRMSQFLTLSMFLIAIISGFYWTIKFPQIVGYGQSGVVYALYGMIFIICILNPFLYLYFSKFSTPFDKIVQKKENFWVLGTTLLSVVIFIWVIFQLIIYKSSFFNEAPDVGYQLHVVSFVLGIIFGTLGFFYFGRHTRLSNSPA
jgi:hypothetical protein